MSVNNLFHVRRQRYPKFQPCAPLVQTGSIYLTLTRSVLEFLSSRQVPTGEITADYARAIITLRNSCRCWFYCELVGE
jgi:hypothetical protein